MMRIIYLHQYFKLPSENGGTRSYDLSKSFVKDGHKVIVITASNDEKFKQKKWSIIIKDGIEIHYFYLPYNNSMNYCKRILVFFKFMYYSTLRLLKIKGDFVLATSTPLTIGVPALIKKWVGKTPYIFEVRDVWPEAVIAIGAINNKLLQRCLYRLEKIIYKNATAIVPLSVDMQKSISYRYPKFAEKSSIVIENISEINRFNKQNLFRSDFLSEKLGFKPCFSVLYAGTFGKVNGLHYVIELAHKTLIKSPTLVYILIGSGAEKENIINLAKKYKVLNKNVFILPSIKKEELSLFYNSVSMGSSFVINIKELHANSANKFFDTLAAAKPILINHKGWQSDVILKENIGYVLPYKITEQDADDFVNYTKNIELHKNQSKNAFNLAREKYSLEKATEKYFEVFRVLE